jgi:hypothetical protein
MSNAQYTDKLNEYIRNMNNMMFTFEVTKCCGYSSFITIYKNETICNLYSTIIEHFNLFNLNGLKEVYFYPPNGGRVKIPLSNKCISTFVKENIVCDPVKLVPIYPLPNPVVYRLYIDDGSCEGHCAANQCSRTNCIKNQTG